jgi:hypothetical protein
VQRLRHTLHRAAAAGRITPELRCSGFGVRLNSGILAPQSSFAIGGKQYVAVLTGWDGDARGMGNVVARLFPGDAPPVPAGGAVWVFALD